MGAFFLGVLRNIIVGIILLGLSMLFYRQPKTDPIKPEANDFQPTSDEGTIAPELFGTGPLRMLPVDVFDRRIDPIRR